MLSYFKRCFFIWVFSLLILQSSLIAQVKPKEINNLQQSWISLNNTMRFSNHWGAVADLHYRANHFFNNPNTYLVRVGLNYWLNDNITITAGAAHFWVAPTANGWTTYANENRLYQQIQMTSKFGKIGITQRIRNEQRWQEKIVADERTNENKFTNRCRYLCSFSIPFSENKYIPSLFISDEIMLQMGKEVILNTFDQNRIFIGAKQSITSKLSFDIGYMLIDQQKSSGYQYDRDHTFRLFFYYNLDFRKKAQE